MKQNLLCALLLGIVGVSANAAEINTDHLMFPEDVAEAIVLAEERDMLRDVRTADQQDYDAANAWIGTTKVEENNAESKKE